MERLKNIFLFSLFIFVMLSSEAQPCNKQHDGTLLSCNRLRLLALNAGKSDCTFKNIFSILDSIQCEGAFRIEGKDTTWVGSYGLMGMSLSNKIDGRPFTIEFFMTEASIADTAVAQNNNQDFWLDIAAIKKCFNLKKIPIARGPQPLESVYSSFVITNENVSTKVMLETTDLPLTKYNKSNRVMKMVITRLQ
jgi:hypothetical protein